MEKTVDQIFRWILEEVAAAGYLLPKVVFIDSTHIKANANAKKQVKVQIPVTSKHYAKELMEEVNAHRKAHGKKPFANNDEPPAPTKKRRDNTSKKKLAGRKKEKLRTKAFRELWPRATVGRYVESMKQGNAFVVCGSIQSVALNLERFKPDDFGYIIVDEAHHASADTYQKVLSYFTPEFTLGLTATPERADDKNILNIFKNTAHKLDIQTAVEIGALVLGTKGQKTAE